MNNDHSRSLLLKTVSLILCGMALVAVSSSWAFQTQCHIEINNRALSHLDCRRLARIDWREYRQDFLGDDYRHEHHFDRCGSTTPPQASIRAIKKGRDYICDQINAAHDEILQAPQSSDPEAHYQLAAYFIGNALHALQDFFSHSNVCELLFRGPGESGGIDYVDMLRIVDQLTSKCDLDSLSLPVDLGSKLIVGCWEGEGCSCVGDEWPHSRLNKDACSTPEAFGEDPELVDCAMDWATEASAALIQHLDASLPLEAWQGFAGDGCLVAHRRGGRIKVENILSWDPNDKFGPAGAGAGHYISGDEPLLYSIVFENKAEASAPAQEVEIRDFLDTTLVDIGSLRIGPIAFGEHDVAPPLGVSEYSTDVDLRPEKELIVRVVARFDFGTSELVWRFLSIDPETGESVSDPLAGFLPPNVNPPEGDGSVTFRVDLRSPVNTGTEIGNQASIVFDVNDAIVTPVWRNTVDTTPPTSAVMALPAVEDSCEFTVRWSGSDTGSGITYYSVFVSRDNGAFVPWLPGTTRTSGQYRGENGSSYAFYCVAADTAGNVEEASGSEATTRVMCETVAVSISFVQARGAIDHVDLKWDSRMDAEAHFRVLRSNERDRDYEQVGDDIRAQAGLQSYGYRDTTTTMGTRYFYMIGYSEDGSDAWYYSRVVDVTTTMPKFAMRDLIPNPTRGRVAIGFDIAEAGPVQLEVFDVGGRRVRTVLSRSLAPGSFEATWDGASDNGNRVASGVYFVRLQSGKHLLSKKMVVVR